MHLNHAGIIGQEAWEGLPRYIRGVRLDSFVVMRNHVHGIVIQSKKLSDRYWHTYEKPTLGNVVGCFKGAATYRIRRSVVLFFDWQASFHDIIIDDNQQFDALRHYLATNPAHWQKDRL